MNKRIVAIDFLKFIAIILMIEGHTLDVLLNKDLIDSSSIYYNIWLYFRGITAPLFLFSFGFLLSYKFHNYKIDYKHYILKAITLILYGYLLRFPSHKIIFFDHVTLEGWKIFFAVDILQLIGFSILFLLFLNMLGNNKRIIVLTLIASLIIIYQNKISNYFASMEITIFLKNYFTNKNGSLFPIIPWINYSIFGYVSYIAIKSKKSLVLLVIILLISGMFDQIIFSRLLTISILFFASYTLSKYLFPLTSKFTSIIDNSLFIYAFHIIILYGCAWFPGLNKLLPNKFNLPVALLFTLIFYILIFKVVYLKNRYFCRSKKSLETNEKIGSNKPIVES